MMLELIRKRRSIRKYSGELLTKETIETLLRAAMQAPTARNQQSWRFLVINNREELDQIPTIHPYANMMKTAGAAIVVMGDRTVCEQDAYLYCDGSAAIMNILYQATAMGLGSCWCAIAPNADRIEGFMNMFELPEHVLPIAVIALGYPEETKDFDDRYDESKIIWR